MTDVTWNADDELFLVAKQGNQGGIAPTPKFKGSRMGCAPVG